MRAVMTPSRLFTSQVMRSPFFIRIMSVAACANEGRRRQMVKLGRAGSHGLFLCERNDGTRRH